MTLARRSRCSRPFTATCRVPNVSQVDSRPSSSACARTGPPYRMVSLTDATIYSARDLWFSDPGLATTTYGIISSWDTSQVTMMAFLFCGDESHDALCNAGAAHWNEDVSAWDTSSVTTMESARTPSSHALVRLRDFVGPCLRSPLLSAYYV